ncbi:unnamed protein product [Colias eurytheme]|nr:unnamed protein product [Colias eurytheme]
MSVPPQGNTTFSVVYLGRREGLVTAHLYIHTSLGVHKYPVSAIGVASEYDVWPLIGLRVPANASVEPELTLYNPTDKVIQVSEVYSSGGWLGLRLAGGGSRAPRDVWAVPPRESRALVRLRVSPVHKQPRAAYVRIKANIPGGGLVVCVEARGAAAGGHARPLHLRLRPHGSRDPERTVYVEAANSANVAVRVDSSLGAARCWRSAPAPHEPCADTHTANGGMEVHNGAHLTVLRSHLEPFEEFTRVARLTLNYAELYAQAQQRQIESDDETRQNGDDPSGLSGDELGLLGQMGQWAWCGGCVRVGKATVPYSVSLLPGTLAFTPSAIDIVTSDIENAVKEQEIRAENRFDEPLQITAVRLPEEAKPYFRISDFIPVTLKPGGYESLVRIKLREKPPEEVTLDLAIVVHTNMSLYHVPLRLYSGKFRFEWEWPNSSDGNLNLGAVGTSTTWRVGLRVHNPACVEMCITDLGATLPGASATLSISAPQCVPPRGWSLAALRVVAPAREGAVAGSVHVSSGHARATAPLALRAHAGRLTAAQARAPPAAPYSGTRVPLVVENSMSLWMRVTGVTYAQDNTLETLTFIPLEEAEIGPGRQTVGYIYYDPERLCEPNCYTGLPLDTADGAAWAERARSNRGSAWGGAVRSDVRALLARLPRWAAARAPRNYSLYLHTTQVVQTPVELRVEHQWPRLAAFSAVVGAEGAARERLGGAGLVAVGGRGALRLRVRNPCPERRLLLHAVLAPTLTDALPPEAGGDSTWCKTESCVWSDAFSIKGWKIIAGGVRPVEERGDDRDEYGSDRDNSTLGLPVLVLEPFSEVDIEIEFAPKQAAALTTYLYLRNNLTVVEGVQLFGVGAFPSFDIGGRRPGPSSIFHFEAEECVTDTRTGVVRRRVVARNTGRVRVRLGAWDIARGGCRARGFRLHPCGPLDLPPNHTHALHLSFAPDFTLARHAARLRLHSDLGPVEYALLGTVPARLLARCAPAYPRPPWDAPLRPFAGTLAFLALAVLLFTAVYDSERLLRRARSARAPAPRAPLDLREVAADTTAPPPPAPRATSRRRRPARRTDPRAERRAFERWRTEVLRRADDDSSRSSEDPETERTSPERNVEPVVAETKTEENVEVQSSASEESTPVDEQDNDEAYTADAELDARDSPEETVAEPKISPIRAQSPPKVPVERTRRSPNNRRERSRNDETVRKNTTRPHIRKEKRRQRVVTPPRSPAVVKEVEEVGDVGESRGTVRWGASWSSVVAGPPLAPIGSDVRRREPDHTDNSLFYYNGAPEPPRPETEFSWRPAIGTPDRSPFTPSTREFLDETPTYNTLGSVWGGTCDAWGWGGAPVRPPPGFAPQPRPYDPFRSLASIWAPAPHDWTVNTNRNDEEPKN